MTGILVEYFKFPQFHLTRRHSVGCGGKAYLREKSFCLWALRCEIPCRPESGYSRLPSLSVQHHRCLQDSTNVFLTKRVVLLLTCFLLYSDLNIIYSHWWQKKEESGICLLPHYKFVSEKILSYSTNSRIF